MQRQIEMVGARAIDGSVKQATGVKVHADGDASSHQIAHRESERHLLGQGGALGSGARGSKEIGVGSRQLRDGCERYERGTAAVALERGEPVGPDAGDGRVKTRTVDESDRDRGPVSGEGEQSLAQRHPRQTQPLGFGVQRGALGLPLGGELIFEVVEEAIPAHETRLAAT